MEKTYYDASQPGSYGGIRPLVRYNAAPVRTVKGWLNSQEAFTLHRPARRRCIRRRTQGRRKGCATCAAAQGAIERGAKTGGVKKI
jgi:hypothetical protein